MTRLKQQSTIIVSVLLLLTLIIFHSLSCQFIRSVTVDESLKDDHAVFFHGGGSFGGIVKYQNTDGTTGATQVDVVSGATSVRYHFGVNKNLNIYGHKIQTGLEWIQFRQNMSFTDPYHDFDGEMDINLDQIRLPLTYNFLLFQDKQHYARLKIKLGMSIGYTFSRRIDRQGRIPDTQWKDWDVGPLLGFELYPFPAAGHWKLGLMFDLYRGSSIYEDFYSQYKEIGNHSYLTFGIVIHPFRDE
jgi:hypothetical protein